MKITELIVILAEYLETHGNIEVTNYGFPLSISNMYVENNEETNRKELNME